MTTTRRYLVTGGTLVLMGALLGETQRGAGQPAPASAGLADPQLIEDLVAANRILAQQGVRLMPGAPTKCSNSFVGQFRLRCLQDQRDGSVITPRVWPMCLRYISGTWTLGGWNDLESAFRVFRLYRIQELAVTGERFGFERGRTLADFLAAADRLGAGA